MEFAVGFPMVVALGALWVAYRGYGLASKSYRVACEARDADRKLEASQRLTEIKVEMFRAIQNVDRSLDCYSEQERILGLMSRRHKADFSLMSLVVKKGRTSTENLKGKMKETRQLYESIPLEVDPSILEDQKTLVKERLLDSERMLEWSEDLVAQLESIREKLQTGDYNIEGVLDSFREKMRAEGYSIE